MRDTNPQKVAKLIQETYLPNNPGCIEAIQAMLTNLVLLSIDKHTTQERLKNAPKPKETLNKSALGPNSSQQLEINGIITTMKKVNVGTRRI